LRCLDGCARAQRHLEHVALPPTTYVVCWFGEWGTVELISYYRVSTALQGDSGLGLEAQWAKVKQLAAERAADVVAEFVEFESGRKADRHQLAEALSKARNLMAVVAVVKFDRIARDAELLLRLISEDAAIGLVGFFFCNLPVVYATTAARRMVLTVMASVAMFEARRISERTTEALADAKALGVKLGSIRQNTIKPPRLRPLPRHKCFVACLG